MIDKKKARQDYKQVVHDKAVFAIRNTVSGKVFLASTLNLNGKFNREKFMLEMGSHTNKALQADWTALGAEHFSFEVLETLKLNDDPAYNYEEDLQILEMIWVEKFRPFATHCYNDSERIRIAG